MQLERERRGDVVLLVQAECSGAVSPLQAGTVILPRDWCPVGMGRKVIAIARLLSSSKW